MCSILIRTYWSIPMIAFPCVHKWTLSRPAEWFWMKSACESWFQTWEASALIIDCLKAIIWIIFSFYIHVLFINVTTWEKVTWWKIWFPKICKNNSKTAQLQSPVSQKCLDYVDCLLHHSVLAWNTYHAFQVQHSLHHQTF